MHERFIPARCLDLPRWRTQIVDFLHDSFRPRAGSGNHCLRLRAPTVVEQVFRSFEVAGHQYPSDDCQHTFASLIHGRILALSPFVRLLKINEEGSICTPNHKTSKMNTHRTEESCKSRGELRS